MTDVMHEEDGEREQKTDNGGWTGSKDSKKEVAAESGHILVRLPCDLFRQQAPAVMFAITTHAP
jgi:hypothetical protein